jgi:hypothetical protein
MPRAKRRQPCFAGNFERDLKRALSANCQRWPTFTAGSFQAFTQVCPH